jgi:hypothetical protein
MMLCVLLVSLPAWGGSKWTQPTPDELKMTADPAAPGAAAVFLYLEETADDFKHEHTYYARIKILAESGKQYGDVVLPYWAKEETIRGVEGRTIHSDGTVVPFTGKPWERELAKGGGVRRMEKGFSMPDVQVGSILEFRYMTTYKDLWAPQWYLQQPIFVHEAHYKFVRELESNVIATRNLPENAQVTEKHGSWELHVTNVPPQEEEEDAPPLHSLGYRVLFFYVGQELTSPGQYWQVQGMGFSAGVDNYVVPDRLKDAVAKIVAPSDTDEQKVRKIYAAVTKLENTSFTRRRTEEEDKAANVQIENAADVWAQQRGNRQQITLLFVGLVRAAGLKAYAMKVTSRDENVFRKSETDWDQLDDLIAIVPIDGIEMYFDPGERYCEFATLRWKHTWTEGVRQVEKGTELAATPPPAAHDTTITHDADLTLDADGQVHGTIRVTMTGNMALGWRQEAMVTDETQAKKEFGDDLQGWIPAGTTVKMQGFTALTDPAQPLVATLEVSGTLGTKTGKRMFLPGSFFEAQARPRFSATVRVNPVYLPYAYIERDEVKVKLPPGMSAEMKPQDAVIPMAEDGEYTASYRVSGDTYQFSRLEMVSRMLYPTKDYPALRDFFQKISTQDQTQVVLAAAPAGGAAAAGSKP